MYIEMIITQEMIEKFNELLEKQNCIVRLVMSYNNKYVQVVFKEDPFVDSGIVNLSDSFYSTLEEFFKKNYNISELEYNNTHTAFSHWVTKE